MSRHIAMSLAYDGTAYAGFAHQPGLRTVQGVLEAALGEPVRGAGRTDAGVHALGQVVDFQYGGSVPTDRLTRALRLPADVVPVAAWEVAPRFSAQRCAIAKQYRYVLWREVVPSPFWCRFALHDAGPLDVEAMRAFAATLVGRRDFTHYSVSGRPVRSGVRTLSRLDVAASGPLLVVRAAADGFLYKMVRRIVGRLLEVGRGQPDRRLTVPARGLCLEWVVYAGGRAPALTSLLSPD